MCVCVDCRFQGHQDIISGIGYLPAPLDCYITSSWDQQLRLWKRPLPNAASNSGSSASPGASSKAAAASGSGKAAGGSKAEASYLLPEDSEDGNNFVSEYEKAHPLVVPKALSQVCAGGGWLTAWANHVREPSLCCC